MLDSTIFQATLAWLSSHMNALVAFGLLGQGLFTMRFIAQWVYSERLGRSAIPDIFWYFSLAGGAVLLVYAILKNDLVFMLGQGMGLAIYIRNIMLLHKEKKRMP